jgi:hypothetical protein
MPCGLNASKMITEKYTLEIRARCLADHGNSGRWVISRNVIQQLVYSKVFDILRYYIFKTIATSTVDSHYYDICYNEILLITIPYLYPNHSQTIEIQTGYIDSLVIMINFPYPISIVITRVYCIAMPNPFLVY